MLVRPALSIVAAALAVATMTACSSAVTPPASTPGSAAATSAAAAAPGSSAAAAPGSTTAAPAAGQGGDAAAAAQGATALGALGALGQEQGSTDQIRALAGQVVTEAKALGDQMGAIAGTTGGTLSADQQAVLADLKARSGAEFDQAWIRAVLDLEADVRAAAEAVLDSPNATEEQKAAARAALADLDAVMVDLRALSGSAGADAPSTVDSGTGGQAQDGPPLVALVLLGAGALLLGGAVRAARR